MDPTLQKSTFPPNTLILLKHVLMTKGRPDWSASLLKGGANLKCLFFIFFNYPNNSFMASDCILIIVGPKLSLTLTHNNCLQLVYTMLRYKSTNIIDSINIKMSIYKVLYCHDCRKNNLSILDDH